MRKTNVSLCQNRMNVYRGENKNEFCSVLSGQMVFANRSGNYKQVYPDSHPMKGF